jgi:hypothetical protein
MSILAIACGIAALGAGFSSDAGLHFWWNLAFGIWVVLDCPASVVARALSTSPDSIWLFWTAQVLTSLAWGYVIARILLYLSKVRARKRDVVPHS